ncbi:hypothetical protein F53441_5362 [Fusarium austroafricanum]|uniref:Uncharacterized protein n=1 Tax=Fusarium austroafricanum TaxID=2364996 RepID=A0A8H4NZQ3_9HYPO|nr:hypothetical protein F53441_5362 [Fusarium austroafricanum]
MAVRPPNKTFITHNHEPEDRWFTVPMPPKPDLSQRFLRRAVELSDGRPDIYLKIYLHHPNVDCPIGKPCDHWKLDFRSRGGLEIELLCMKTFDLNGPPDGDRFCAPYRMCLQCSTEPAAEITCKPCQWFNEVRPNFGVIEKLGYMVVLCRNRQRFVEGQWMDRYGRMLVHMGVAEDAENSE